MDTPANNLAGQTAAAQMDTKVSGPSEADLVLDMCTAHWKQQGKRILSCKRLHKARRLCSTVPAQSPLLGSCKRCCSMCLFHFVSCPASSACSSSPDQQKGTVEPTNTSFFSPAVPILQLSALLSIWESWMPQAWPTLLFPSASWQLILAATRTTCTVYCAILHSSAFSRSFQTSNSS